MHNTVHVQCTPLHVMQYRALFSISTAKCIDHYTQLRVKTYEETSSQRGEEGEEEGEGEKREEERETRVEMIDTRLESIVNRMFERCLNDCRYKQAIGIAFETRRVDILHRAIHESVGRVNPELL